MTSRGATNDSLHSSVFLVAPPVRWWPSLLPTAQTNLQLMRRIKSSTASHRRLRLLFFLSFQPLRFCAPASTTWQLFEELLLFFFLPLLLELNNITAAGAPRNLGQYVADVLQGLVVDNVRVKVSYTGTHTLSLCLSFSHTHRLLGTAATFFSECKTIYSFALCGNSGNHLSFAAI